MTDPVDLDDGSPIDYARLKGAAKSLQRPLASLYVLSGVHDPFMVGLPSRQRDVEWLMGLWSDLGLGGAKVHVRRIHYVLVSQASPIALAAGGNYENTIRCQNILINAARDARYLGLIPEGTIIDRKNPEPAIYLTEEFATAARVAVDPGALIVPPFEGEPTFYVPSMSLTRPIIPQRYHLEIWCEKSTMNDILMPLGPQYRLNVITGTGELSLTHCEALIARARISRRPVRIIYVSDFDPAGENMPVSVARKLEFAIRKAAGGGWLDVQVRAVALTHDQAVSYGLPRTPIKESDRRGSKFESRYGAGATELDALEALRPGELERILVREIERYFDTTLDRRIDRTMRTTEQAISRVQETVLARHRDELDELEVERGGIADEIESMRERIAELEAAFDDRAQPVLDAIEAELADEMPDPATMDWPEPAEGDEDDDPLYDSSRGYLDQIERYRAHQGKEEVRTRYERTAVFERVCQYCGEPFTALLPTAKFCGVKHRYAFGNQRRSEAAKSGRVAKAKLPVKSNTTRGGIRRKTKGQGK